MLRKIIVLVLMGMGIALLFWGRTAAGQDKEYEYFQKFQETIVLYDKADLLQFENDSVGIAAKTKNNRLAAVTLYNAGTVRLNEFLADGQNPQNLKRAIFYLQESLLKDPNLERAKRNLEIAWRQVKENDLANNLGLEPIEDNNDSSKEGGEGEGEGEKTLIEKEISGTEPTKEPLPYNEEEGFGRGGEINDY